MKNKTVRAIQASCSLALSVILILPAKSNQHIQMDELSVPKVRQIEKEKQLSDTAFRDLWLLDVMQNGGHLFLTRFTVKPNKALSIEGLPEARSIETIHYVPGGQMADFVSHTSVWAGGRTKLVRLAGFGQSIDVGEDLQYDGGGSSKSTVHATMSFRFQDHFTDPTKAFTVSFWMQALDLEKAKTMANQRGFDLPMLSGTSWTLTLPPASEEM